VVCAGLHGQRHGWHRHQRHQAGASEIRGHHDGTPRVSVGQAGQGRAADEVGEICQRVCDCGETGRTCPLVYQDRDGNARQLVTYH
jgi:hypothetical protein